MNYFEIFGLESNYKIDENLIEERYLSLQKKFHPDNFDSAELQIQAAEKIMKVNDAYDILKNPNSLMEYYLLDSGYVLNNEEIKNNLPKIDLEFLLECQEKGITKQTVEGKLLSIRLTLEKSIKEKNKEDIIKNLARLKFFNKSLQKIK